MKLYSLVLPLLVFSLFGYGYSALHRATDDTNTATFRDVGHVIKADAEKVKAVLAKVEPNNTIVYNQ